MHTSPSPVDAPGTTTGRARIHTLDVLRGFALCGILLVNIPSVTGMAELIPPGILEAPDPVARALDYTVQLRFFPIFSFLFGVGFALFLDSAQRRSPRPRLLLLRRLVFLGLLGYVHGQFHPGEVLLNYALFGLVFLLPASYIRSPRWLIGIGAALVVLGFALRGGPLIVPGLFVLGMGMARAGIFDDLQNRTRQLAIVFAASVAASIPAMIWSVNDPLGLGVFAQTPSGPVAGFTMAVAYASGLALLMNTRAAGVLTRIFAPLGRMALSNYLGATAIMVPAGVWLGLGHRVDWVAAFALAAGILVVQWAFSALWLRAFRYGPVEWVWRVVTWWQVVPNRRRLTGARPSVG